MEAIKKIIQKVGQELMKYPNVVSVGVGYKQIKGVKTDQLCIVVGVTKKLPLADLLPEAVIPLEMLGVKTDVVEVGEIRALQLRTEKWRPAPGGVSVGHRDITAGTIGLPRVYKNNSEVFLLSNNHVLANTNDGKIGDAVLQPGPYDTGKLETDQIAILENFVKINWETAPSELSGAERIKRALRDILETSSNQDQPLTIIDQPNPNLVDAAIARPLNEADLRTDVLEIGEPSGIIEPALDMKVQKSGRTSGLTNGSITQLFATVKVNFSRDPVGRFAVFTDQIITTPMGQPGDSGSSLLDLDKNVVGLLFAGSDYTTIFNQISNVFRLLQVKL